MRMRKGTLLAQQLCTSQHVLNEVPPSPRAIYTVHVCVYTRIQALKKCRLSCRFAQLSTRSLVPKQ